MATEEEVTDTFWEDTKTFAVAQQQCYYELLPECIIYESDEHKYLKQNIGYACFGPPKSTEDANAIENCYYKPENSNDTDVTDTVGYNEEAKKMINKIYDKICKCVETDDSEPIYFGIIYNMIFGPQIKVKEMEEEKNKSAKTEVVIEVKKDEKELFIVLPIPIFKFRKSIQKKTTNSTGQENAAVTVETSYETWYIDSNARVYKSWADYTGGNNLPECTMVLPKDGVYQPDPAYPVTNDYSTVLLEIMESPACTWETKFCNKMDIASNIVGFGTIALSVASMFTPLAPVVAISGFSAAGVAGAWSIGRNSQQLADRSSHEESISIFDKEAFPHYLGITGTAFGLGAIGGSAIISNVTARGMTVNTFGRVAFNTVQSGNLFINGVGVIYQSYNMIDKYKTEGTVSFIDTLNLATHLMFFYGSVIKVQFASDIIESTQGRVMSEYKESLSTKRLRKNFNRAMKRAAQNNICKMSENAEVIRYIRYRQDLLSNQSVTNSNQILDKNSCNRVWAFERGRLMVNDIVLLDPMEYVMRLIKLGIFIDIDQSNSSNPRSCADDSFVNLLTEVLYDLLSKLSNFRSTRIPTVSDFEPLIREMSSMNVNVDYLRKLFAITVKLIRRSENMDDFLLQSFTFVWQYCKANLKQWGMSLSYCVQSVSSCRVLKNIIDTVFEAIDIILDNLARAFVEYMNFVCINQE